MVRAGGAQFSLWATIIFGASLLSSHASAQILTDPKPGVYTAKTCEKWSRGIASEFQIGRVLDRGASDPHRVTPTYLRGDVDHMEDFAVIDAKVYDHLDHMMGLLVCRATLVLRDRRRFTGAFAVEQPLSGQVIVSWFPAEQ